MRPPAAGNGPAVLVTVDGFRARTGNIRVAIYGSDPALFLARGQTLRQDQRAGDRRRADADLRRAAGPGPLRGRRPPRRQRQQATADWSDGGGFSRNPRISLLNLRPNYNNVAINVGRGVTPVNVVLNYRFGLSIRPGRVGRSMASGRAPLQSALDRQPVAAAARPGLLRGA